MNGITDFWDAYTLAALMSEMYGGEYEIGYSDGRFTVTRTRLSDTDMDPAFRQWRADIYRENGVTP